MATCCAHWRVSSGLKQCTPLMQEGQKSRMSKSSHWICRYWQLFCLTKGIQMLINSTEMGGDFRQCIAFTEQLKHQWDHCYWTLHKTHRQDFLYNSNLDILSAPFSYVGLDFLGPFPTSASRTSGLWLLLVTQPTMQLHKLCQQAALQT